MNDAGQVTQTTIFEMLMESQHWSQDQMLAFQNSQLEQLLRHARATVPFYQKRLNCLFRSNGSIDWGQWQDVPILTREDVAENFAALQSSTLPAGHGSTQVASTSGSTGLPIYVTYSKLLSDVCKAVDWRAHAGWGFDWSENLVFWHKYKERDELRGSMHSYGPWGPSVSAKSKLGKGYVANTEIALEARLEHLARVEARHLSTQGNIVMAAAETMGESAQHFPLNSIVSHGVELDPQFDSSIKAAFGTKMLGLYSSKEAGRIAHMCTHCRNYHVNPELVHVEILDHENQPCPPGVSGRVIVTNFFNAAQPFIRYDQGDMATWAKSCVCGSKLPTLQKLDGRVYHLFRKLNGQKFAPQIPDSMREQLGAAFWQFWQTDKKTILVKYKAAGPRNRDVEEAFASKLKLALADDFDIHFEAIDALPLTRSGKFLKYVYATS